MRPDTLLNREVEGTVAVMIWLVYPMYERRSFIAAGGVRAVTARAVGHEKLFALLSNIRKLGNLDLEMGAAVAVCRLLDKEIASNDHQRDRYGDSGEPQARTRPVLARCILGLFSGLLGNRHWQWVKPIGPYYPSFERTLFLSCRFRLLEGQAVIP